MPLLECCESSGLLDASAVISTKDSWYCGMTLITEDKVDTELIVTDSDGKVLAIVGVIAGPNPIGYKHDCPPQPILALGGIETTLTGVADYVVRYVKTISNIQRA